MTYYELTYADWITYHFPNLSMGKFIEKIEKMPGLEPPGSFGKLRMDFIRAFREMAHNTNKYVDNISFTEFMVYTEKKYVDFPYGYKELAGLLGNYIDCLKGQNRVILPFKDESDPPDKIYIGISVRVLFEDKSTIRYLNQVREMYKSIEELQEHMTESLNKIAMDNKVVSVSLTDQYFEVWDGVPAEPILY